MAIQLDHLMVSCHDRDAAARQLAELLGVPFGPARAGAFTSVYVSDSLTIDFDQWTEPFATGHYCFRVSQPEFDAILARIRAAGLDCRSTPHGPVDRLVNTQHGGRIVYWSEPGGHHWEMLTESYARLSK